MFTLLIIEDEKNIRDFCKRELLKEGYRVIGAKNGIEALRVVETEKPDLIILDMGLPLMNGIDTLSKIKNRDSDSLIILYTSAIDYEDNFSYLGADAWVEKSGNLLELKRTIDSLLKKYDMKGGGKDD